MAVIARAQVTIAVSVDAEKVDTWYMLLPSTSSAPTKPSVEDPSSDGWSLTEPTYDGTTTSNLWTCQRTMLTDGTFYWGSVCLSSSYEASKRAMNAATAAASAVSELEIEVDSISATVATTSTILEYDYSATWADDEVTFEARLTQGGEDVTSEADDDRFVWYLATEDGTELWGRGVTITIPLSVAGYRTSVIGGYEDAGSFIEKPFVTAGGDSIVTSDGAALIAKIIWVDE